MTEYTSHGILVSSISVTDPTTRVLEALRVQETGPSVSGPRRGRKTTVGRERLSRDGLRTE